MKRVPQIQQMEVAECGAVCLSMILGFYGHHAQLSEVRQRVNVSRDGATALDILQGARSFNLDAGAIQIDGIEDLKRISAPSILHWNFKHFVVLEAFDGRTATIVDPAQGRRRVSREALGKACTGIVLIFKPNEEFSQRARSAPSFSRYASILLESRASIVQVLLASFLIQMVGLATPMASKVVLDYVIMPSQSSWLWVIAFALGVACLGRVLIQLVRAWTLQALQVALDLKLLGTFVEKLLKLPVDFLMRRDPGDLLQKVQDNTAFRSMISSQSISALLDGLLLLGYAVLMMAFEWRLGIIVLGAALLRGFQVAYVFSRSRLLMASELFAAGREQGGLVNALTGLETTKAVGAEGHVAAYWARQSVAALNGTAERRVVAMNSLHIGTAIRWLGLALLVLIGGGMVVDNNMTIGTYAAFIVIYGLFMGPFESLLGAAQSLQFFGTYLNRLDDVTESAPEHSGNVAQGLIDGCVELVSTSFHYGAAKNPVLDSISLKVDSCECVYILGRSGSGKSTLARLLVGLHQPTGGEVRVDGRNLRDYDTTFLRRRVAMVMQETFLFSDTVFANIALGWPEATFDEVREAAAIACIDEVIEALPHGYLTRIGEGGADLSGGERQRLSIARSLVRRPAILVLDEATSSLDATTAARLEQNLQRVRCTKVIITHRIPDPEDNPLIIALEQGRLVESGRMAALLKRDGLVKKLLSAQGALVSP